MRSSVEFFVIQCVISRYELLDTCLRTIPLAYYLVLILLFASAINQGDRRSVRRLFVAVLVLRPHDFSRSQLVLPMNPAHIFCSQAHQCTAERNIDSSTTFDNLQYWVHRTSACGKSIEMSNSSWETSRGPQWFTIVNMSRYETSFTQCTFADFSVVFSLNWYPQNRC